MKRIVTLVALILSACPALAFKQMPKGAGVVTTVRDANLANEHWTDSNGVKHYIWQDTNLKFVVIRDIWTLIEPNDVDTPNKNYTYDWSYLDNAVSLARSNAKNIVISVSGGYDKDLQEPAYPSWLQGKGAYIWAPSDIAPLSCPAPWDTTVQTKWRELVKALGARYDGDGHVIGVTMWAGGTSIECYFATTKCDACTLDNIAATYGVGSGCSGGCPDQNAGAGGTFWASGAEVLIQDFINAFPTTRLYLATGQNYIGDNGASMTSLACWFTNLNPSGNGLQSCALSYGYPAKATGLSDCANDPPITDYQFPHTNLPCSSINIIMYQYLDPIANPDMDGTNEQVMRWGYNANAWAIQCYPQDPGADNEAGVDWFNSKLGL